MRFGVVFRGASGRAMTGPYKRKKYHYGDTHLKKGWRVKRRTRDLDQIDGDLKEGKVEKLLSQAVDYEKPGLAQFYCVHCAKDHINKRAFEDHVKSKPHKRRLHALKTDPYTIEEAHRAAGMGSYVQPGKRKMETLIPEAIKNGEDLEEVRKRAKLEEGGGDEAPEEQDGGPGVDGDGDEKM